MPTEEKFDETLAYLTNNFGAPENAEPVSVELLEKYRTKVPGLLIQFWQNYGFGTWHEGFFHICNPDKYQGLLKLILGNDSEFPAHECTFIGYTAFGDLSVWHPQNKILQVRLIRRWVIRDNPNSQEEKSYDPNISITSWLADSDKNDFFENTESAKPLNKRALKKLGKLMPGECYGFVPAVGMGGLGVLGELKKQPALVHFSFIAQIEPIELRYFDFSHGYANSKCVFERYLGS